MTAKAKIVRHVGAAEVTAAVTVAVTKVGPGDGHPVPVARCRPAESPDRLAATPNRAHPEKRRRSRPPCRMVFLAEKAGISCHLSSVSPQSFRNFALTSGQL